MFDGNRFFFDVMVCRHSWTYLILSAQVDHPHLGAARRWEVVLEPGDVLFVPRHWWHDVECLETAVTLNLWLPHPRDGEARVHEAIVS